ncbi:sensor histidine kinase [Clostridium sp. SYSU_GA19001]|uniref:sensor histidine kinase n=1 Tax=Clostridium caldaquaticum TaxID=2940653 RepID=UPI0020772804|nr:sensor histidine kinase [Clostridium caldaquaticum]MCM8710101.1 sensor histidine kinase [Clostridium caldaquaticum]
MINLLKSLVNNLGYVILIAFIISNLSVFKKIIQKDEFRTLDLIILSLTFAVFGIIGTYTGTDVYGAIANTRIIGIMTGGILCGPFVGIVSGVIAGLHRFTYNFGGITSVPCAITTIVAGFFSGFIYKRGNKFKKWFYGLLSGLIMESIEMLLILLISKPYSSALSIVKSIYLPMSFTNALGICILILLIQKIFNEKEQIAAAQAQLALEIANKTLPYFREINSDSLSKICSIIKDSTGAAAVAITDKKIISAHVGLGSDHHISGEPIQTTATKQVIKSGTMRILNSTEEIQCFCNHCPLKSAIIVPLKEGDEITGTLKLYYAKENGISYTDEKLAIGLSQIISTQLEISKVGKLRELATKAEIKALQAQINPHFLFNALNTIASFMRFNPNSARELIVNLSTYLRYNIEETSTFVDINKELEQVKAYVEIEKARFGDKLTVIYNIDKNINIKVPSLIIQPLVENSIKHGILEGSGSGCVKIEVIKHSLNEVKVIIEDDGIGIPQAVIDSIYEGTIQENKIGISNVHNRLKYIYGCGLIIERLTKGTKISFILHKNYKEVC